MGTTTKFVSDFWRKQKLNKTTLDQISVFTVKLISNLKTTFINKIKICIRYSLAFLLSLPNSLGVQIRLVITVNDE